MNKKIIIILSIIFVVQLRAQTTKDILNKVQAKFNQNKQYKINIDYKLYKGETGKIEIEDYKGIYIRDEEYFYSKIHQTELILATNYFLKVNHEQKILVYSNKPMATNFSNQFDIEVLLKAFDVDKLRQDNENWYCDLNAKKISFIPIKKITLVVGKNDLVIKKQILLYSSKVNFSKTPNVQDFDLARIEIGFNKIESLTNKDKIKIDKNRFIKQVKDKIILNDNYKNYELIQ